VGEVAKFPPDEDEPAGEDAPVPEDAGELVHPAKTTAAQRRAMIRTVFLKCIADDAFRVI